MATAVDLGELQHLEFGKQDIRQNGHLDAAQFRFAMGQIAWRVCPTRRFTGPWYDALFHELDKDHDGVISFDEFQNGVDQLQALEIHRTSEEWRRYARSQGGKAGAPDAPTPTPVTPSGASRSPLTLHEAYAAAEGAAELGSGVFGSVVKVRHRRTGTERACKRIPVETWQAAELVRLEVSMLKNLDHVCLLRLYEVFYEDEAVSLVTELCQGGSLAERLMFHREIAQPMTEGHAARCLEQMLGAAAFCHERGVVHRDLKPENILFLSMSADSPLKVIDFGLADTLERLQAGRRDEVVQREGAVGMVARMIPRLPDGSELIPTQISRSAMQRAGTPHYMAPEVYGGEYGPKADTFSIGVMAVEMLCLRHPFYTPGDDLEDVRRNIVERGPDLAALDSASYLSPRAVRWCRWLLRASPASRASASEALVDEWFSSFMRLLAQGARALSSGAVCEALVFYATSSRLRQVGLHALAQEVTEPQVAALRQAFLHMDRDGDGVLGTSELLAAPPRTARRRCAPQPSASGSLARRAWASATPTSWRCSSPST